MTQNARTNGPASQMVDFHQAGSWRNVRRAHGNTKDNRAGPETWLLDILKHGCSQILQTMSDLCRILQRSVAEHSPPPAILTGAPFERLHIDLTGPHPRSRRGSVYIVTCIDPFTKWAEAFPAPNKEAATVARIIVEQIIGRFGCPIAILSDQGKEMDGNLMAEIC